MLINPHYLDFKQWAFAVINEANVFIPSPSDETKWREWAYSLGAINQLKNVPIPSPLVYDDRNWKTWAYDWLRNSL